MSKLAIIVMTCDKYSDTWIPFSFFFKKFWSDCKYPIYFVGETQIPLNSNDLCYTKYLKLGNIPWSNMLSEALKQIPESYVSLIIDDIFLCEKVSDEDINTIYNDFLLTNADVLRLSPGLKCKKVFSLNDNYFVYEENAPYRISTQPAIWKKEFLNSMLQNGENAWQFERRGTERCNEQQYLVLCTKKDYIQRINAIEKGKWEPKAVKWCEKEGCMLDLSLRPQKSYLDLIIDATKKLLFSLFPKIVTFIQNRRTNSKYC